MIVLTEAVLAIKSRWGSNPKKKLSYMGLKFWFFGYKFGFGFWIFRIFGGLSTSELSKLTSYTDFFLVRYPIRILISLKVWSSIWKNREWLFSFGLIIKVLSPIEESLTVAIWVKSFDYSFFSFSGDLVSVYLKLNINWFIFFIFILKVTKYFVN